MKRWRSVSTPSSSKEKIEDAGYFWARRIERYQGNIRQDWIEWIEIPWALWSYKSDRSFQMSQELTQSLEAMPRYDDVAAKP